MYYANKYSNKELLPFAEYLFASTTDIYYHGGKNYSRSLQLMEKYLNIENGMISILGCRIPKLALKELLLFEYEFFDLCMPFLIPELDRNYDALYNEGPYEFIPEVMVEEDDIVLDCGANMGYFSALISSKLGKGKVYSFEPSTSVIKNYLSKTAENNCNIEIAQYALSDIRGEIEISLDENNIGASSIMEKSSQKNTEIVPLIDLV